MMKIILLVFYVVINFCFLFCDSKSRCFNQAKVAVISSHKRICSESFKDSVSFSRHENYLGQQSSHSNFVEIGLFPICENSQGVLRTILEAIIWTGSDCLKPPSFLGFVGPNDSNFLDEALKITSVLRIPHIVNVPTTALQAHSMFITDDYEKIIQGVFKFLQLLRWSSFILEVNSNSSFYKYIGKRIAKEKNFCLQTDEEAPVRVLHIGEPDRLISRNVSIIIIVNSIDDVKKIKDVNLWNSYLIVEIKNLKSQEFINDSKLGELYRSATIEKSNELKEQQFLNSAIETYLETLEVLCSKKNCSLLHDYVEWSDHVSRMVKSKALKKNKGTNVLQFYVQQRYIDSILSGRIVIHDEDIDIYWDNQLLNSKSATLLKTNITGLEEFYYNGNKKKNCSRTSVRSDQNEENTNNSLDSNSEINVLGLENTEWWTMISSVAGVGIAMFSVGFFAVYIVYTNVRGPKLEKNNNSYSNRSSIIRKVENDTHTKRFSTNEKFTSTSFKRENSQSSIRSDISVKSM